MLCRWTFTLTWLEVALFFFKCIAMKGNSRFKTPSEVCALATNQKCQCCPHFYMPGTRFHKKNKCMHTHTHACTNTVFEHLKHETRQTHALLRSCSASPCEQSNNRIWFTHTVTQRLWSAFGWMVGNGKGMWAVEQMQRKTSTRKTNMLNYLTSCTETQQGCIHYKDIDTQHIY